MNAPSLLPITERIPMVGATVKTELPIVICELDAIADQLVLAREAIDELRLSHPHSPESNVNAVYMSPWKSHLLNAKLQPLCASVVEIAKAAAPAAWSANFEKLQMDLIVSHCWGAIYEQADYTAPHNHFPADVSCVVYLEADDNAAPLVFSDRTFYQPRPRTLVMFPGIAMHEVPATPGRRVCVAMNLFKQLGLAPGSSVD